MGKIFPLSWIFGASEDYQRVQKETHISETKFILNVARCSVYKADIRLDTMDRLSDGFVKAVNTLPLDDYGAYLKLISSFGTHLISSVIMGAKAIVRSEFNKTAWSTAEKSLTQVQAGLQQTFFLSASPSVSITVCSGSLYFW